MLQEVDPFLKRRWLHLVETRSVKWSINGASTGVLAMIVKKTTNSTPDLSQELEVTEQRQDHSGNVEDHENSALGWHLNREIICWNNWWYIPLGLLQKQLLRSSYNDLLVGHFGYIYTLELVKRKYFWPKISANIKQYVNMCLNYHWVKLIRHKPHGQLELLPSAAFLFDEITMDFIIDLLLYS